jgi:hypothetical protein
MTCRVPGHVVTLCACFFWMLAAMPARASEQLTGDWLQKNLPGRYTLVIYGFDVGVNAAPNGNLTLSFLGDQLKGRWAVKGDQLCVTLIEGQESETACSVVHYDGNKYYSAAGISFHARE